MSQWTTTTALTLLTLTLFTWAEDRCKLNVLKLEEYVRLIEEQAQVMADFNNTMEALNKVIQGQGQAATDFNFAELIADQGKVINEYEDIIEALNRTIQQQEAEIQRIIQEQETKFNRSIQEQEAELQRIILEQEAEFNRTIQALEAEMNRIMTEGQKQNDTQGKRTC